MSTNKHPGDDEYLGAILQWQEQFLEPKPRAPRVGDTVSGVTAGRSWTGLVTSVKRGRLVVDCDGLWLNVPVDDAAL
jgi:hypothetical protein